MLYNRVRVITGTHVSFTTGYSSHVYVITGYAYLSKTTIVNNADMSGINVSDVNVRCSG